MKNPEKPGKEGISGIFRKLLAYKQPKKYSHLRENPRWNAKTDQSVYIPERPAVDPALKFKRLTTSRGVISTPLQDLHTAETPLGSEAPEPEDFVPAPDRPAAREKVMAGSQDNHPLPFALKNVLPAFWTVASILSFAVNIILILALFLVGRELFVLKSIVGDQLLGGLYENFIFMDQAHIRTDISVADTIPISFNLPISQDTVVVLTQNTAVNGANVRINSGGISINSSANIVLPAGTNLPVHLEMNVPVTTNVPIKINVPVDIPLEQTELHKPFIGLQQVVAPFYSLLQPQIKSPQDVEFCQPFSAFCSMYFQQK